MKSIKNVLLFLHMYIQVIDIAMRYHFAASSISVGRSLYDESAPAIIPVDASCEIWRGHYQVSYTVKTTPPMLYIRNSVFLYNVFILAIFLLCSRFDQLSQVWLWTLTMCALSWPKEVKFLESNSVRESCLPASRTVNITLQMFLSLFIRAGAWSYKVWLHKRPCTKTNISTCTLTELPHSPLPFM